MVEEVAEALGEGLEGGQVAGLSLEDAQDLGADVWRVGGVCVELALLSLVGEVAEGVGVCLGVEDAVFKVVEGGGGGCSLGFEARRTGEEWMLLEEGGELVEGGDAEVCGEDAGSEQGEGFEGLSGCALLSSEGAIASVEVGPQRLQIKQGEGRPRRARGAAAQPWRCCSLRQGR